MMYVLLVLLLFAATTVSQFPDVFIQEKTWHEVLGTTPEDSVDTITKRYRELSLLWHPDKCNRSGQACSIEKSEMYMNMQQKISEAYSGLKELISTQPDRHTWRKAGDMRRSERRNNQSRWDSFINNRVVGILIFMYSFVAYWPFFGLFFQGLFVPIIHLMIWKYATSQDMYILHMGSVVIALGASLLLVLQNIASIPGVTPTLLLENQQLLAGFSWVLSVMSSIYIIFGSMYFAHLVNSEKVHVQSIVKRGAAKLWLNLSFRKVCLFLCLLLFGANAFHGHSSLSILFLLPIPLLLRQLHMWQRASIAVLLLLWVTLIVGKRNNRDDDWKGFNQVRIEFFAASSQLLNYIARTLHGADRSGKGGSNVDSMCSTITCLMNKSSVTFTLSPPQIFKLGLIMALIFSAFTLVWQTLDYPRSDSQALHWYDMYPLVNKDFIDANLRIYGGNMIRFQEILEEKELQEKKKKAGVK